jgi:HEAT repeat protein
MIRYAVTLTLVAVGVMVVVLVLAIVARQALYQAAGRRQDRIDRTVRPVLFEILDSETLPAPVLTGRGQRRALHRLAISMLPKVRGDDRAALVRLLEDAGDLDAASSGLRSRRPNVRAASAELLGSARRGAAVPAIAALLADRHPEVRIVAARALGKLGDPAGCAPLLAAVDGSSRIPTGVVSMALVRLGMPGSPALRDGLAAGSRRVRSMAAQVLGQLGDLHAADGLVRALQSDVDLDVRMHAAEALGRLGLPRTLPPLIGCLEDDASPDLRAAAARALGLVGSAAAADALAVATTSSDESVARRAAAALAAVALDRLTLLAGDGVPHAQEALARATLTRTAPYRGRYASRAA